MTIVDKKGLSEKSNATNVGHGKKKTAFKDSTVQQLGHLEYMLCSS